MFISVDLPDPDGPMIDDEIAALDLERDALQTCTGTSPSCKSLTRSLISMMAAMALTSESRPSAAAGC